jgi:ribokinase
LARVAVVGHVEWVEFARVPRLPEAGEIVHAERAWSEAAGGGSVAAAQLGKLAGDCLFLTAVGDDELGERARADLAAHPELTLHAARRAGPQRRAFTHVDAAGERAITIVGARLFPHGADPLPWSSLRGVDALYFAGGDAAALRAARAARVLVATPRAMPTLAEAGVAIDVLVASASDEGERYERGWLDPEPRWVARTDGTRGGRWAGADGSEGHWSPAPPPGPIADSYGCGDSFAAGLTYGLGAGLAWPEALEVGARCGAGCLTGHGPYPGQPRAGR